MRPLDKYTAETLASGWRSLWYKLHGQEDKADKANMEFTFSGIPVIILFLIGIGLFSYINSSEIFTLVVSSSISFIFFIIWIIYKV